MSTLAVVLIAVVALLLLLFVGGLAAARRRTVRGSADYARHVAAADQALEQARASDKGWDRARMEQLVREALAEQRRGWDYRDLHLVLVDDRPGVTEDRAHFVADGEEGAARVVLERGESGWFVERVE